MAKTEKKREQFDVIVIGGGQAGLSVGYYLKQQGVRFAILDASERVGDAWRKRWDSLRLFSPARFDGLAGMRFPAPDDHFPTKDEMADYLEAYAKKFELPVRTNSRVDRVSKQHERYVVEAAGSVFEADQVIVAMSSYQKPRVPDFARELSPDIVQIHSSDYKGPSQLNPGAVVVVGAGNSGAEIAIELVRRGHPTVVAGPNTGEPPIDPESAFARWIGMPLMFRVVFHRVLTIDTPMGRKARPKMLKQATPLIRTKNKHLLAAGAERTSRVVGARDGKPVLEDGRVLDVANVVWCTGFHPGHAFVDLPIFDESGEPKHVGGVVSSSPGLYFVGLHFLFAMSSAMIHGVGRDADRIVKTVMQERRVASAAVGRALSPGVERQRLPRALGASNPI
jgi:putative flavoprotein involved in K+ transport